MTALLAGTVLAAGVALPAGAADDERPRVPFRVSLAVSKSGKGTKLKRLAVAYPSAATLSATCTRGRSDGGPCPANGSPVEGLACAPIEEQPETTKCELRSTASKVIWMPKGETMTFIAYQRDHLSTGATITFTSPGRYRVTKAGA